MKQEIPLRQLTVTFYIFFTEMKMFDRSGLK